MIAVVDYKAGNIGSVANALTRLGAKYKVISEPENIRKADGVIFPGQGRAGPAMNFLRETGLDRLLPTLEQPFLGICLGMQLMVKNLEEDDQPGLAIIPGSCSLLKGVSPVPHMGWNKVAQQQNSPLFEGLPREFYQYFVHSYAVQAPAEYVYATTDYGVEFASIIQNNNFYAVQFHPEKSADQGRQILKNFLNICKEER